MAREATTMINPSDDKICQEIVRHIREVASPRKIVLFGSRARGDGDEDSDFDLLVVKDEVKSRPEEAHQINVALLALPIFADVLVRSAEEDRKYQHIRVGFQKRLMEDGVVLYERSGKGVGSNSVEQS
ncbi:MAG: nucleotidyltransferase domain-containing protein [Candidatus Poribacteria bacterium]|nr:nucleotidyltransferase domain-containing protein [Candidatus Poribacteria bacterium]